MNFFKKQGRAVLLAAVLAVGAVCLPGCWEDDDECGCKGKETFAPCECADGNTGDAIMFRTAKIGNQTWMAENLNIKTAGSWCYENSADSCAKYGRLYTYAAAKKACPAGWHLPSPQEWHDLTVIWIDGETNQVFGPEDAGKRLKSKTGWHWNDEDNKDGNGTDDYWFSALPGGYRAQNGSFGGAGYHGMWWTTQGNRAIAHNRDMIYGIGFFENAGMAKEGYSVRCLAD